MATRKAWTEDEGEILLTERHNRKTYRKIAERLGNRTVSACQTRYQILKLREDDGDSDGSDYSPNSSSSRDIGGDEWSLREKKTLSKQRRNDQSFKKIAKKYLPGRTIAACREQYRRIKDVAFSDTDGDEDDDNSDDQRIELKSNRRNNEFPKTKTTKRETTNLHRIKREKKRESKSNYNMIWKNYDEGDENEDSDLQIISKIKYESSREKYTNTNNSKQKRKRKIIELDGIDDQYENRKRIKIQQHNVMQVDGLNNVNKILEWILSLSGYEKYIDCLKDHFINNVVDSIEALKCIEENNLENWGINNIIHRKNLLKHIKKL